jgi:hypothetical protein
MNALKQQYWSLRHRFGLRVSALGERLGLDSLTYNAVVFELFGHLGAQAAPGLADSILELFPHVRSVVDLGCGTGHTVRAFRDRRVRAEGFEHSRKARSYASNRLQLDLHPLNLAPGWIMPTRRADLAMSVEVAEHVSATQGRRLVALLAEIAPLIVFTAASPGQGGMGHVNEQPKSYWVDQFARAGCEHDPRSSKRLTALCREKVVGSPWIASNMMVFRRGQA